MSGRLEDGNEVFFRIKRITQLRKLMNAYCDRQSVDFNSIAFLFDGRRLRGEQTPDEAWIYWVTLHSELQWNSYLFLRHSTLTKHMHRAVGHSF